MGTGRRGPIAGAILLVAAAGCLAGFFIAPIPALVVAVVIAVTAAILRRRLGSWWLPVLVTSAVAFLLAGGILVISWDFGGASCQDRPCGEETPISPVPGPG
jgi:hypothetical protein